MLRDARFLGGFKHLRYDSGKDEGRTSVLKPKKTLEVEAIRSYGRQRGKILGEHKYSHCRAQMALSGEGAARERIPVRLFQFRPSNITENNLTNVLTSPLIQRPRLLLAISVLHGSAS